MTDMFMQDSLLASFWERLVGDSTGITLLVLVIAAAAALVLIVVALVLLCRRAEIELRSGKDTRVIRAARHQAVDLGTPEREGYVFDGWYRDPSFKERAENVVQADAAHAVFYAKWIAEEQSAEEQPEVPAEEAAPEEPAEAAEEQFAEAAQPEEPAEKIAPEEPAEEEAPQCAAEEEPEEEQPAESPVEGEQPAEEIAPEQPLEEEVSEESVTVAAELPVEERAAVTAQLVEESAAELDVTLQEEEEDEEEASEGDEIDNALVTLVSGGKVFVQYRRSFRARLIQADGETKDLYNCLRSELLSVDGVKERVSWNYDSFNIGRKQFAKVNANRKSLILYLALAPSEMDEKYRFRDVSAKKRYAAVPVRYKITGSRSYKYATELIAAAAERFGASRTPFEEKLDIPYEEREALIKKRLIRVYAKRETGETVSEEELEKYIEEGATIESLSAYTVTDKVSVNEADVLISDATAKQLVALAEEGGRAAAGKRSYINLDTISANFCEGEKVDLASLKEKGLLAAKTAAFKVLARGSLDKSLVIEANDFSLPAVKMIALTGGKVIKLKKNTDQTL